MSTTTAPGSSAIAHTADGDAQPLTGRRASLFVSTLFTIPIAILVVCAAIPRDLIPAEQGMLLSIGVMLCGFGVAGYLARRLSVRLPISVTAVAAVALLRVLIGWWHWGTFQYDTDTQLAVEAFSSAEEYTERSSDVLCLDEIVRIWDVRGIHYISKREAYIPINNRPPAHIAALVIRAFGMRYHAYFPFVALVTGLGALAMMVALRAKGISGGALVRAAWLALLWPFAFWVGNVTKDVTLCGVVALCTSLLVIAQATGKGMPAAVVASLAAIPLFRPAYAVTSAGAAAWLVLQGRGRPWGKWASLGVLAGGALLAERFLAVRENIDAHAMGQQYASKLFAVPVVGRLAYALGTPFPWSHLFAGPINLPYATMYAQQVVTVTLLTLVLVACWRARSSAALDAGAVLGLGMGLLGAFAPLVNAMYVHVGTIGMLPAAMTVSPRGLRDPLARSLLVYVLGNVFWVLVR